MNYLGYNKDNFVEGDSGIDNGTLRINNYILPSEAGTSGQVLTMDANNQNTSFQDASSGSLTRIGAGNNDTVSAAGGTSNQGFLPSFSGVRLTDIKNIPPGSSYVIEAQSVVRFTYDGTSPSVVSYLQTNLNLILGGTSSNTATISNQANSNVYPSPIVVGNIYRSYWYYKAVITRSDTGSIFYLNTFSTMNRFGNTNYLVNMNTTPNPPNFLAIDGDPNDTTLDFTFQFDNFLGSGTSVTYDYPSINWYISQLGQVSAPTLLTNDHTQLTNLNSGDSGHTQFALLQGRNGGQVLSGGITPLHFLTLKSHTAGLNNIVIKDLNTTFEKNIDLNNNSLLNGLGLNTQFLVASAQTETPLLVGSGGGALAITSNDLTLTENNLPGGEYINFNNTRALTYKTLDMNTNDITNANVIVRASNGNVINFDNDVFPPLITSALTIESGAGKEININADNVLKLNGNSIIHNSGTGPHQFNDSGGLQAQFTSANIEMFKNLDMKNNNINNVNQVSSSGTLTLLGALGNRCDIGVAGATRLEVEDGRVLISQFADLNIQDTVIYVQPNTMPVSFDADKTYILVGSRSTSNSYVLPDNCNIMGTGKNNSIINYTGAGSLFTSTDNNLSITDITLTSSDNAGILITASNVAKNKTINFTGLQIRNSKNVMSITGYDLIDFNNCIFTYIESGSLSPIGVRITDASKVQVSSSEFLRWFQEGGTPATTFFNGNMLEFVNVLNALNINGSFYHPQYNQNGIDLSAVTSTIEGTITSNTFIDINLNTVGGFLVLNIPPAVATNYVVEGNSIYPNLRANLTYVFSGVNASNTILSGGSNPNVINTGGLAIALVNQFSSVTAGGLATYLKKRSANFLITASANLQVIAGGAGQRVGLGLRVNGIDIPNGYSYVTLDSAGTEPKQTTLNFTGVASQNDTFELTIFNTSGNNDVLVSDLNFAGIEI